MELHFNLKTKDDKIYGNIDKETLGTWSDFKTTLGVDAKTLEDSLQSKAAYYINIANVALQNGITIPSFLGITVKDIDITSTPGLLSFGGSIVPPTFVSEVVELMKIWNKIVKDIESYQIDPFKYEIIGNSENFLQN